MIVEHSPAMAFLSSSLTPAPFTGSFVTCDCPSSTALTSRQHVRKPFQQWRPRRVRHSGLRMTVGDRPPSPSSDPKTESHIESQPTTSKSEPTLTPIPEAATSKFKKLRPLIGLYWLGLLIYTSTIPGKVFSDTAVQLISLKFSDVNQIAATMFNIIGTTAISYAMILSAGASRQRKWLPLSFFSVASLFVGFVSVGPYLTLREYAPQVTKSEVEERGPVSRALESRWLAFATVALNLGWYAYGFGLFFKGSELWHDFTFFSSLIDMTRLFESDRFIRTMSLDFLSLSLFLWGPLTEDMRRRGWFNKSNSFESVLTAISILITPALGPSIYTLCRPSLPEKVQVEEDC